MKHVSGHDLANRSFLIVEDEYLIASDIAWELTAAGAQVIGLAGTVLGAMTMVANSDPDFAIVDLNLRGEKAYPVIDRLIAAGVTVLVVSAYDTADIHPAYQHIASIQKHLTQSMLISATSA